MASPQSIRGTSGACMHTGQAVHAYTGLPPNPSWFAGGRGAALDAGKRVAGLLASRVAPIVTLPYRRLGSVWAALHLACVAAPADWGGTCVSKAGLGQAFDRERVLSTAIIHSYIGRFGKVHTGGLAGLSPGEQGAPPAACGSRESRDPHAVLPCSLSTFDFLVMLCPFAANSLLVCFGRQAELQMLPTLIVSCLSCRLCALWC